MKKIQALLQKPVYRYLIIGGSVYLFELVVIVLAQHYGMSAVGSVTLSYCLATIASFFLQKLVTFSDKRMHHKILVPQAVAVAVLVVWNLAFSLLVVKLLQNHIATVLSRTFALGITTIWNFYIYKTKIFKNADELIG